MNEIQNYNPMNNIQTQTPLTYYGQSGNIPAAVQPVQNNVTAPIYQYPTTSLYNPAIPGQCASGVNINIYNPSGMGTSSPFNSQAQSQTIQTPSQSNFLPQKEQTPAASAITDNTDEKNSGDENKTKKIVELTDDYIKTLENYLRSQDAAVRRSGINQLIKRYEEDSSRYDNPALTALLNIALQDPDETNRMLAMSPIASGSAHGDKNSAAILQNLQNSDKMYGQEAKMASEALLNTSQTTKEVPDNSQKEKKE